jgi:ABC-type sugar transport system permease subunit
VNEALMALGLGRSRWHTDPDLALICVAVVSFWKTFGLNMMLWLSALVGIPQELRDAASLDGAGFWARLIKVELPIVSPTAFFIGLTTLFVVLDDMVGVIDPLTHGGPAGRSSNLLYDMWKRGMGYFLFGQASASSVLIMGAVIIASVLQFRMMGRRVTYG